MNKSKCPVCGSKHTIKYGVRNGIQTYKCADCGNRFRNSRLPSDMELWKMYQENKQTVAELASSLRTSPSTIKRRLRNIAIEWEQPPLSGHGFVPITDAIPCFKPLVVGILTSLNLFTIHVVHFACLLQSFNAKRKKIFLHGWVLFYVVMA